MATCQSSTAATCRFFTDQFFGYSCELTDATVTEENVDLVINTSNHAADRTDADVRSFTVANTSSLAFFPNSILRQFPSIRYLILDNSGLTALTPGSFDGCSSVAILFVRHTTVASVPAGLFADCSELLILDLSENLITEIDDDAFVDLPNLLELDINYNQLTSISRNLLRNQVNLEILNFRYNQISEIEDGAFSTLRSLNTFYLRNNRLTEFRAEAFGEEIPSLVFFNLNENRLTSVPRLPARAPRIKYIYVATNQIAEINEGDFTFSYQNVTNIDLSENQLTTLAAAPFEGLVNLDIIRVSFNRIRSIDHEFFDRIPTLYTFYFERNPCASARFDNIRSIDQDANIQATFDRCFYEFFEPEITATCNFVMDVDLGYTCETSQVTFLTFRDKFTFTGEHLADLNNTHVVGLRITNSNFARVPPSIFRIFPNIVSFTLTGSQLTIIDENTFQECGLVRNLDLSNNRIRRLNTKSFENCFYVQKLNLDDNRITEIEPCDIFLLNIYQTTRLSLARNICVSGVFQSISGDWLIYEYEDVVRRHLNQCFSLWYTFLDTTTPAESSGCSSCAFKPAQLLN